MDKVLEIEKTEDEHRRLKREATETEAKQKKIIEKEALIDELMFSHENASKIVGDYAKQAEKTREESMTLPIPKTQSEFSTGVKFGQQATFLPLPKIEEGPSYVYEPPKLVFDGPIVPTLNDVENSGYIRHIR